MRGCLHPTLLASVLTLYLGGVPWWPGVHAWLDMERSADRLASDASRPTGAPGHSDTDPDDCPICLFLTHALAKADAGPCLLHVEMTVWAPSPTLPSVTWSFSLEDPLRPRGPPLV